MPSISASLLSRIEAAFANATPSDESFTSYVLNRGQWRDHTMHDAARPGIYVWAEPEEERVVRIGMSTKVARARALEHIRDNTGERMEDMAERDRLQLILFVSDTTDSAILRRIERHLEENLDPLIPSKN